MSSSNSNNDNKHLLRMKIDENKDGILFDGVVDTNNMNNNATTSNSDVTGPTNNNTIDISHNDDYYGYQPTRKDSSDIDDDFDDDDVIDREQQVVADMDTDDDDDDDNDGIHNENPDNHTGYTDIRGTDYDDDDAEEEEDDDDGNDDNDDTEYVDEDDDFDDGDSNRKRKSKLDTWTLRQTVDHCCKYIDIGTAVLPGPLFTPDIEDYDGNDVLQDIVTSLNETHYGRIIKQEFNSIVIEHHLKWSPLLSIDLHPPNERNRNTTTSNGNAYQQQQQQQQSPKHSRQHSNAVRGFSSSGLLGSTTSPETSIRKTMSGQQKQQQQRQEEESSSSISQYQHPTTLPPTDQPRLGRYDFYFADSIVDWAIHKGNIKKIKGHVLIWHVTSPIKILEELSCEQVYEEVKRHIFTVMNHFRGRISTWDVVNEALAPDGTLADTIFLRKLGPNYIEQCFRWAHEADPTAKLLYNDNKVEQYGCQKADGFYDLLADLKMKNVPIHGCSVQCHWNAAGTGINRPPTPRMFKQQIRRLGKLGLTVNISELDVRVSKLGEDRTRRTIAQKDIYYNLIAAALSEPSVDGIWLWGFTDRHTWVSNFYYDDEPLIFDEYYQRKPSYYSIRDALATLTPGYVVAGTANRNNTSNSTTVLNDPSKELNKLSAKKQRQQGDTTGSSSVLLDEEVVAAIAAVSLADASHIQKYPTIPIESDADNNGNTWGHEWMIPEPEVDLLDSNNNNNNNNSTARPDWEIPVLDPLLTAVQQQAQQAQQQKHPSPPPTSSTIIPDDLLSTAPTVVIDNTTSTTTTGTTETSTNVTTGTLIDIK